MIRYRSWRVLRSDPGLPQAVQLRRQTHNVSSAPHEPLRLLFCGADEFSIFSLRAICRLRELVPKKIESVDVVCRPDKRVGRGLKQIHEVPIKPVAKELGLPLHQLDTFTGWAPPSSVNLIVAVSFGLLVPPRLINAATYGGLNVHPSLLPDLRGPAPLQHTLLKCRSHTGVTLQTMHPSRFDHGRILAQTPAPGVPVPKGATPNTLVNLLGPLGAEMLAQAIERDGFLHPDLGNVSDQTELQIWEHAPKITPDDRHIDWRTWTADEIVCRDRVLGRLWDRETLSRCSRRPSQDTKRVTFHGHWEILSDNDMLAAEGLPADPDKSISKMYYSKDPSRPWLALRTSDGRFVRPKSATIEGEPREKGIASLVNALRTS